MQPTSQGAGATPAVPHNALEITLALAVVVTLAGIAALTVGRITLRLLKAVYGESLGSGPRVQRTVRIARVLTFVVTFVVLAFPALDVAGVELGAGLNSAQLARWAAETGVRIVALLLLAFVVV